MHIHLHISILKRKISDKIIPRRQLISSLPVLEPDLQLALVKLLLPCFLPELEPDRQPALAASPQLGQRLALLL